jgi:hypothetical protein
MMRTAHIATQVAVVSLTVGLASAESAKCILELPIKRTEHWSFRIVNGQRCWFPDSERTTVGRKIKVERIAKAQESARRSLPKVGLSRPPPAAKSEPQLANAFAQAGNDRVTRSSKVDLLESPSPTVENKSQGSASFGKLWNDRVTPRDPFSRTAVTTATVVTGGPTASALPHSPVAAQRIASPPIAATTNDVGIMLWFGLGIGALGISLFGRTAWKKLRQWYNLVRNKIIARKQQSLATIYITN